MGAFLSTCVVIFREGLEALLIVGIAVAYLRQTGRRALLPAVYWGVGAAVVVSALIGWTLAQLGEMGPAWEGALALVAAVLIISCTVHVLRAGRRMKQAITQQLTNAAVRQGFAAALGVAAFLFLMVTREGVEAATMVAAVAGQNSGGSIAAGGIVGFALAGLLAAAWARLGRQVSLTAFFQFAAVFLVLFSVQLVIYAFHEFAEAGVLPLVDNELWHDATEPYGPEGEIGQWLTYALAIVPSIWLIALWLRDSARRTTAPAT
ncbi:MAG: FTR1 family protein [Alphaproteobacteria bacterium]|nr:FTR1 family protein [Alphaproteobacteria bacterium]